MTKKFKDIINELDRDLLRQHRTDRGLFDELRSLQVHSGILHGSRAISPFLRPYFLERSRYEAIGAAAFELNRAFETITDAALEFDEIMTELGVSEKEARWARLEPGYPGVSINSRLDTFLSPDGFAFLEYNGENPAGIGDQRSLVELFFHVPEVKEFLGSIPHYFPQPHVRLLDALVSAYRDFGGRKVKPSIAIVDWEGVSTAPEFAILAEYFEANGHEVRICFPDELEFEGPSLTAGDFEIDIFFKRVIIHEFLERFDETHPLYRACVNGAVCMANSFRSKIPHKKASFAILTDERYKTLFTPEQTEIVRRHVPWTRMVRPCQSTYAGGSIDLLEFIRNYRERLVLKPNDDYGGKGIAFGWECTAGEWDDAIATAISNAYVVQERVAVEKVKIPVIEDGEACMRFLTVDFDPFLFRGTVEGGMVRLAQGSLVNISSGGGETALSILEGY